LREVRDGAGPGHKAFLKALRIEARKEAAKGVVGRNAMGQGEEGLQPSVLALAEELHILEAFPATQQGADSDDQHIEQAMLLRPLNTGVL
jgi:hypothetical protein